MRPSPRRAGVGPQLPHEAQQRGHPRLAWGPAASSLQKIDAVTKAVLSALPPTVFRRKVDTHNTNQSGVSWNESAALIHVEGAPKLSVTLV